MDPRAWCFPPPGGPVSIEGHYDAAFALPGLLGCAGARPSPPSPAKPVPPLGALDVLRQREPDTEWDSRSLLKEDFDQDGKVDYAFSGIRGDRFVVGIVQGPVGESCRHRTLEFAWDGTQDALCSREAKIALERVEEEEGQPGRPGINLSDDRCDAFHIFWDPEQQTYDWWRL